MPSLLLAIGENNFRRLTLPAFDMKVGRSGWNQIVLDSRRVSRVHAVLVREHGLVTLRDLDSTNGSFVNGERVTSCVLRDGDSVQFGDVELRFVDDDAQLDTAQTTLWPMLDATDDVHGRWEEPIATESSLLDKRPSVTGGARGVGWIGNAVSFTFAAGGRPVTGLITYEALADHFGAPSHSLDADSRAIEAYIQNHLAINVAASLRYAESQKEPVLLRTTHF